ncbi:MAG: hypothetical protein OXE76_01455 [Alphaproteobacteria bacterium]|nr:hypothetical protein [Alphaproteobacteria bacterium]
MTTTFDTLAAAQRMENAGLDRKHAAAIAATVREVADSAAEAATANHTQLATKADLTELRQATTADLAELRQATKADLTELRQATKAELAELRQSTKAELAELRQGTKAGLAELRQAARADLYRALWLQAAGIVGAITALAGIAVALATLVGNANQ